MTHFSRRLLTVAVCSVALTASAVSAFAQTTPPSSLVTPVTPERAEPDFALVNLPTTRPLRAGGQNFHLTHRFLGNLRAGSFSDNLSNIFGLDNGAMVGLEYRVGITDKLQAAFYRTSVDKTIQFSATLEAVRQSDVMPVSVAIFGAVEGNQNFGWHAQGRATTKSPSIGASISRTIGEQVGLYVVPVFVGRTFELGDTSRNTFMVGLGARARVSDSVYLVGEITPRLSGYAPGKPEFGFGLEKRSGGHMFQITFSNTTSTTFGQVARGGLPTTLYLGFNLGRKFL